MTSPTIERFDRTAEGYLRWWAPVLAPASVRLVARLSELDPGLPGSEPRDVLDVGCGTGNLLLEAARRWPGARLTGLDGSVGMLAVAAREAEGLPAEARPRVGFLKANATALPFEDASFDLVTCAFVLQQVPHRPVVLREILRVLRPGGIAGIAGWTQELVPFAPEVELEAALAEAGIARPATNEIKSGHYGSANAAAAEMRRAGFRRVAARQDALEHLWTAAAFATYRETTRDRDLFAALDEKTRRRGLEALARRLGALAADEFVYRPPIVSIVARRPG
jgi:ubiquinone/menaquinone biosynthesis C-methylase UbiE